jgi:hypothetical protein
MKRWIEAIAKRACDKRLSEFQGIISHFDRKLAAMQGHINAMKTRLDSVDRTILNMTKEDLDKFMQNKFVVFESSIDDKIVGLYRTVDEKIAGGNGNVKATTSLLRRIAVLEGVKDAAEHRRSSQELLERLEEYKKKLLALDRTDENYGRYQDAVNILNWVLGLGE